MTRSILALIGALSVGALVVAAPATAAERAIFDAHVHYSQGDWSTYTPEQIIAILTNAGVKRALVSSTPDDGTLKLYERAPRLVVPFLRPYRTRGDMSTWTNDAGVQAYVEERLRRGIYRGIGEFHLSASEADGSVVKRFAQLAADRNLFMHAHVDAEAIERLLRLYPNVRMLWAHAGMSAGAATVDRLVGRYPKLWVDLALRSDVAPVGTLDPAWRAVFVRYPDRFMVGTDTWTTSRWSSLADGMRDIRVWLDQLPSEVADRIAFKNGEQLFPAP